VIFQKTMKIHSLRSFTRPLQALAMLFSTSLGLQAGQPGQFDPTFNFTRGVVGEAAAVAAVANNKMLAGGLFVATSSTGVSRFGLARFNADGSVDTTFNANLTWPNDVQFIFVQQDGKIIITGQLTDSTGVSAYRLRRLLANGAVDTTFAIGTGPNNRVNDIAQATNGDLILGGTFTSFNGATRNGVARISLTGSLDASYAINRPAGTSSNVNALDLDSQGRLLIARQSGVSRLNADGTNDSSLSIYVEAINGGVGNVRDIKVAPNNLFYICGNFNFPSRSLVSYTDSGAINGAFYTGVNSSTSGFTTTISNPTPLPTRIAIQADGKIIVTGNFSHYRDATNVKGIIRINTDGTLDSSFSSNAKTSGIFSTAIQANGQVLIGGAFEGVNGRINRALGKLNSDGTLALPAVPAHGFADTARPIDALPTADGKTVIIGDFELLSGQRLPGLCRLNADNSLDTTFNASSAVPIFNDGSGGFVPTSIYAAVVRPDGRMVVSGDFINIPADNGKYNVGLIPLLANGDRDTSFRMSTGFGNIYPGVNGFRVYIDHMRLLSNGKIMISDDIVDSYNGVARHKLIRILANGNIDNTFDAGLNVTLSRPNAPEDIRDIEILTGEKIYAAGSFNSFAGTARTSIVLLTATGALDSSFVANFGSTIQAGSTPLIHDIIVQTSGKVVALGDFANPTTGVIERKIIRLNLSGTVDTTFTSQKNAAYQAMTVDASDRVIVSTANSFQKALRLNANGTFDTTWVKGNDQIPGTYTRMRVTSDGKTLAVGQFDDTEGKPSVNITRLQAD
jgi:uncharacterized delta-60 repeat protein